ncbi:MAG: Type II secretion system F domain protein, partial [candidate division CPR2 bacterium GW2011_GWD1_39_7]
MPKFEYLGKEKSGHMVSGDLDAKNRNEAVSLLIEKGLTPIKINECKRGIFKSNSKREGRISGKEKVVFSRQLAILINSGLPLAQSFSILQKQTSNQKFKKIIEEVGKDLQGGISLSDALSKHPKAFSTIFVNMVRAGEIGGTLDQTLERLANQMEKDREIIAKVRNAMMYPSVIIVAMIGAVTFLMVKVVPQLSTIFEDMGGELPINTRALIFISNVLKNYLIFVILSVVGTIYALRRLVKTNKKFKFHFNAFLLKVPLIKMVIIKLNTARFARTLGMLLNSGIPVMESLEIVNNSISNEVFLRKLAEAR